MGRTAEPWMLGIEQLGVVSYVLLVAHHKSSQGFCALDSCRPSNVFCVWYIHRDRLQHTRGVDGKVRGGDLQRWNGGVVAHGYGAG